MFENCVKTCLFCRAKVRSPTVSNRFPLDTFGPSKKKRRCGKCLFLKICGLNKFWPDHVSDPTVSDRFRLFPTVSDRFIFSEGLIGPIPFIEGWSSAKPVRTMTLKFFGATLVRVHCTKYCILTLISIDIQYSLKMTKSQELVKFNTEFNTIPLLLNTDHKKKSCISFTLKVNGGEHLKVFAGEILLVQPLQPPLLHG